MPRGYYYQSSSDLWTTCTWLAAHSRARFCRPLRLRGARADRQPGAVRAEGSGPHQPERAIGPAARLAGALHQRGGGVHPPLHRPRGEVPHNQVEVRDGQLERDTNITSQSGTPGGA
eukprot:1187302-Prorocentrum_minimum.AAC.2